MKEHICSEQNEVAANNRNIKHKMYLFRIIKLVFEYKNF